MHRMLSIEYEEFSRAHDRGYRGMTLWGDDETPLGSFTGNIIQDFLEVMSHVEECDDVSFSSSCFDFVSDGGKLPSSIWDCINRDISISDAMKQLRPPSSLH